MSSACISIITACDHQYCREGQKWYVCEFFFSLANSIHPQCGGVVILEQTIPYIGAYCDRIELLGVIPLYEGYIWMFLSLCSSTEIIRLKILHFGNVSRIWNVPVTTHFCRDVSYRHGWGMRGI